MTRFQLLFAGIALIVVVSDSALAQYADQGRRPYVHNDPNPPVGEWIYDDEDDDGSVVVSPREPQPGVSGHPLAPPVFSTPDRRLPPRNYRYGASSGADEDYPPRPPRPLGPDMQTPYQVPRSVAPSAPRNLASLPPEDQPEQGASRELPPQFRRQLVSYAGKEPAGTLVIDTSNTFLYLVLGDGKAVRYGIGVGREGFAWSGSERISRMAEWPDWHPPAEMIEREPHLPRFMAGGEGNPLGARALYLGKTLYRIHGTNQPSTIGTFVSSGCIRLTNADIEDLYSRIQVGARVVVLSGAKPPATAANERSRPPVPIVRPPQ
jgi:lipoprotein-anchoring transpeptidase ErfK/SrfK